MQVQGKYFQLNFFRTGKTKVITHRIYYLIKILKVRPEDITALTFSKKATDEMIERIHLICGKDVKLTISTFHSLCFKILKAFGSYINLGKFNLCRNTRSFMKQVLEDLNTEADPKLFLSIVASAKNKMETPELYKEKYGNKYKEEALVYQKYQQIVIFIE